MGIYLNRNNAEKKEETVCIYKIEIPETITKEKITLCMVDKTHGFESFGNIKYLNVSKAVCKLKLEVLKENKLVNKIGSGFLLNFFVDREKFYCLYLVNIY